MSGVGLARLDDGVVALHVAGDDEPHFGPDLADRLAAAAGELLRDDSARVLMLMGGKRYFTVGVSRDVLLGADAGTLVSTIAAELPRLVLSLPLPTIAAMEGHAVGGGFMLGLWSDLPILAEEALYGANFMALGFTPGMGASTLLEEALGPARGREMLFTGRLVKGRELRGAPGIHAVVPRERVRDHALALAREIASGPREALMLCKKTVARRRLECVERTLGDERAAQARVFAFAETRERILRGYPEPADSAGKP